MSDQTPTPAEVDVIANELRVQSSDAYLFTPFSERAETMLNALSAAGLRVERVPDDQTRDEVLSLIARVKDRKVTYEVCRRYAIVPEFDHRDMSRLERMADLLERAFLSPQGDET